MTINQAVSYIYEYFLQNDSASIEDIIQYKSIITTEPELTKAIIAEAFVKLCSLDICKSIVYSEKKTVHLSQRYVLVKSLAEIDQTLNLSYDLSTLLCVEINKFTGFLDSKVIAVPGLIDNKTFSDIIIALRTLNAEIQKPKDENDNSQD